KVRLADLTQGLEVFIQALRDSEGTNLAGNFPAGLSPHSVRNHEQRTAIPQGVLAKWRRKTHFTRGQVANHKVVFIVLTDATHVRHTKGPNVDGVLLCPLRLIHGAHSPSVRLLHFWRESLPIQPFTDPQQPAKTPPQL